MRDGINMRARLLVEHLSAALPSSSLKHHYAEGIHRFAILTRGLVYQITVPDQVLATKPTQELKDRLAPLVDRVLLGASPRRVLVTL